MFTDSRLEEISAAESQPVANRLLSELILELRRHRSDMKILLAIMPESIAKAKAAVEQPKPPVVVKKAARK